MALLASQFASEEEEGNTMQESCSAWNLQSRRHIHRRKSCSIETYLCATTRVIAHVVNQTHKFFSTFVHDVHVLLGPNFSLARVRKPYMIERKRKKERENRYSGLSFSSASGKESRSRRGPFGIQNMCGRTAR